MFRITNHLRLLPPLLVGLLTVTGCAAGSQAPGQADPPPVEGAVAADLDGDGTKEWVRGLSDTWTTDPVEIYSADGQKLFAWRPYSGTYRASLHTLPDQSCDVFLYWVMREDGQTEVGIQPFTIEYGELQAPSVYGWGLKHANSTLATRASFTDDGHLLVEWDLGDPVGHTRIRKYELNLDEDQVKIVEEKVVPQEDNLVYPAEPEDVLRAAHLAATQGLSDELLRYFASADVAQAFQESFPSVAYELTSAALATATEFDEWCNFQPEPAQPDAEGAAPFLVTTEGAIHLNVTVGTVWFDTDETGRTVIRDFQITTQCPS